LLLLLLFLLTAFGSKDDTHRSILKFQTAVLSVLRAIFPSTAVVFCFFLRYWYLLDAVCHAALLSVFRSMRGVLFMILSASSGCWYANY
jgi:hypothetical protein